MDTARSSLYVALRPAAEAARTPPPASCPGMEESVPTYEYRCRDCANVFDRIESLSEHGARVPKCPKCNSRNVEQVLTSFFAKTSHKG
jgi:putative FmdB family regulatory protein